MVEDEKKLLYLPSLSRHVTSENKFSSESSISKCQIACLSVAQTNADKVTYKLNEDSYFPVSTNEQEKTVAKYQRSNTLPFSLENSQSQPKPKLLEDLEKFLVKELQALKVKDNEHNELTFMAHREVFEYLIDNFKTYKPLLSRIKNKYEMRMNQLKIQINSMKPLKQMAATTAERYEHKIMALREQDKQRLVELQFIHKMLSEKLSSLLRSQHDTMHSIDRLKDEIEDMNSKYVEEFNQCRYLVTKMNNLRFHIEKLEEARSQRQEDPQEDPVTIRERIRVAREQEKISSKKINEMIADYSDLIPQSQFDELEEKYQSVKDNCEKTMNEFKNLKNKHSELLSVHSKLTDERNFSYIECEKLQKTEIAIVHWNKCIDYINGGQTNWQEVAGASCQSLLEILQEVIDQNRDYIAITGNVAIEPTLFTGLGINTNVPHFLRFEGKVQGHRMLVRDCYLIMSDIWKNRTKDTQSECKPLVSFLDEYLQQKFPNAEERVKWAYTFNAACQKLAHNYDNINLFLDILNGNVDESIYQARKELYSNLLLKLRAAEKNRQESKEKEIEATEEEPTPGFLTQEEFSQELMRFFSITNPEDNTFLLTAALQQLQTKSHIEYETLFTLDNDGEVGSFLTTIKDWQQEVQANFINQLRKIGGGSSMNASQLKKTLQQGGLHQDTAVIERLIAWVFGKSTKDSDCTLPADEVFDRLTTTFIPVFKNKIKPSLKG